MRLTKGSCECYQTVREKRRGKVYIESQTWKHRNIICRMSPLSLNLVIATLCWQSRRTTLYLERKERKKERKKKMELRFPK